MRRVLFALGIASTLLAPLSAQAQPGTYGQGHAIVLKAAHLFDAKTGRLASPGQVWVNDGRIQPGVPPTDAEVVDLGDRTLLPGLIDCHVHLTDRAGLDELAQLKRSKADRVLDGVVNARKVLEAGFTTVRDCGSDTDFGDVALRNAVARGDLEGPRVLVSGPALSITGGHGDANGFPTDIHFDAMNLTDSPQAAVRKVREWRKRGVDQIKIMATGGVLSNNDDPGAPSFSPEEFKAIVDEAARRGTYVCAHAHGDAGIRAAVEAGVRSIEHGSLMSPETARLMKQKGTFEVPTLYALESILEPGNPLHVPAGSIEKARVLMPLRRAGFKAALDAGVTIAYGTDIGVFDHARAAADFPLLVSYGMTPAQALQTATVNAAALLRLDKEIGTLEPGKAADIVAVDGDPLANINTMLAVPFVMKGGKVWKKP
ncbi:MAG TPA: amidohydrolase family protein [Holophagaceae bacterium]|jgi:imidazolonepropionase-like amidohydrolase|nr:amidohydrolase family protein [Holophagaceae bacterium]